MSLGRETPLKVYGKLNTCKAKYKHHIPINRHTVNPQTSVYNWCKDLNKAYKI